jgi:hypothetical protein
MGLRPTQGDEGRRDGCENSGMTAPAGRGSIAASVFGAATSGSGHSRSVLQRSGTQQFEVGQVPDLPSADVFENVD